MNKKTEGQGAGTAETRTEEGVEGQALLEKIIDQGRWKDPANRALARDIIGELAKTNTVASGICRKKAVELF